MMRKNKLSAIMMILVLVMAAALTGCSDKKAKEQEIQNKVSAIDTAYEAFTAEADHAKKLEAYKTMVSEDEAYIEEDAVKEKYTAVLADMKKAFTDEYDSTIAENTVDVSKEEDEKKVSTYKDNLTKALGTIKADAVCTYDDRVTAIKKAAAEKKAEEEAKAKKESEEAVAAKEKTAKSSDGSASGKSTSASGSSNSGSSGSSSSGSSASSSSGSSSSGSNSGSSGSYSDYSASDNSGSSTSSSSGSSDASSASGSSSGSESSGGSSGSESGNHTWATGSMTGDDGQEHEFTIKDNILYNDEGESEDISAWVAH